MAPDHDPNLLTLDPARAAEIRAHRLQESDAESTAARLRAVADPTRLTLMAALRNREEMCVCDLAWIAGRAQNLVSHHLQTLRNAGLIRGRKRGKMVIYNLTPAGEALLSAALGSAGISDSSPQENGT